MSSSLISQLLKSIYKPAVLRNFVAITIVLIGAAGVAVAAASFTWLRALQPVHIFLASFLPSASAIIYFLRQPPKVYLVDYACFSGSPHYRTPFATFVEHARQMPMFSERSIRFVTRLLQQSGLGEETLLPPASKYIQGHKYCTFQAGREEAELVVFSAIDSLFSKTSIRPEDIDILIVNCTVFNPTPSFPDMIINRYKMRSNIHSVHLSGMGCSAGLISIELASKLLQAAAAPGARALVVSTETLAPNYYIGNERAMLLPYCLFRMGGAAVLLSTSPTNARFRLSSIVRTLTAADKSSYRCIHQEEDDKGNRGVNLSTDLLIVASTTLKANIVAIAPLVLPFSEQVLFALSFIRKKMSNGKYKLYVPDFKTAFEHFCIHAGGRAVIDGVQRSLGLADVHVEPSRMTLHRFGNTSSSSTWYELAYIEAKGRMCTGSRVWMIGFGSGFKCNSVVLQCIVPAGNTDGPWAGCIRRYPVELKYLT